LTAAEGGYVKNVICLALLVVATTVAAGQAYTTTSDGRYVISARASGAVVPAARHDAKLKTIFSNLSDYKYGTYDCCSLESIQGPNTLYGPYWVAVPFTPDANVKLTQVEAGVRYFAGTNSVAIWLAADASGLPGGMLAGPVDVGNLPLAGGCCSLAIAKFKSVPLTKGTQYWIVAGTDSNSMDTADGWTDNSTDMRIMPFAFYHPGWQLEHWILPSIGIFGK
jgi:hypothetical protein